MLLYSLVAVALATSDQGRGDVVHGSPGSSSAGLKVGAGG